MTPPERRRHLIERAAERLGGDLLAPTPRPELRAADADVPDPGARGWKPPVPPPPPGVARRPVERPGERLELAVLEQADLQIGGTRRTRIAEEYMVFSAQLMRTRQALARCAAPDNLLMVTSTQPGEGKSFTAMNMAASLAQNRHTGVVLIDGDPKRNSMTERLGLSDRRGLFDLVEDPTLDADALILPTVIEGFSILPIGAITDLQGFAGRVAVVLHRLARLHPGRLFILDAPPCRATSDPNLWSSEVTQIVMVVEAARTQRGDVERAVALLDACPNIVLVLNKTRFDASPGFGAYGYYGA